MVRVAVGRSDDDEADGIISNGKEQQELDGRVMKREDLGEGEGRGQGDRLGLPGASRKSMGGHAYIYVVRIIQSSYVYAHVYEVDGWAGTSCSHLHGHHPCAREMPMCACMCMHAATCTATIHAREMSVAVGIPQPLVISPKLTKASGAEKLKAE